MKRKTISKIVHVSGKSWYEAKDTWVSLSPGNQGIRLSYMGVQIPVTEAVLNQAEDSYTTSIFIGDKKIFMTEHLFSAVRGLEIDDLDIEFGTDEVPFSADASIFIQALLEAGFKEVDGDVRHIVIDKPVSLVDGPRTCDMYPSDSFEIISRVSFDFPIGDQSFSYLHSAENYVKEIGRARSLLIFPIDKEDPWKQYRSQFPVFPKTFPKDPKDCPFIAYDKDGFINGMRFENETARHKILDFIGDLLALGKPIKGRFVLNRPGHLFNAKIVDEIKKQFSS